MYLIANKNLSRINTQITPPVSRRAPYLARDQRLQILTLHRAGLSNREIADQLEVTILQVRNMVRSGRAYPQPRTERSQLLSSAQVDELEAFVCSSRQTRQMSLLELALHSRRWSAGEHAIRNALRKRGDERRIPRSSLPLSENHRAVRIWWSEQHLNWREEWSRVFWCDETWINDGQIMSGYRGQDFDDTFVIDRYKKNNSWMCWGSFAGIERGPCIFWEREWGSKTSEGYSEHILPRIGNWFREKREETGHNYIFMHDNASVHKGRPAREFLIANGVESMPWPANSPDLNPIENVWSMMKY
ncbi:hypothetical protein K3495_g3914 [Podosphaera aphanis]|nr:hypothetical protein K3495_g3914 [Podosphaera aphanis]